MTGRPHPTGLPIEAAIRPLCDALAAFGSAVLVAPPGSGKTTVVPLRLLRAPELQFRAPELQPSAPELQPSAPEFEPGEPGPLGRIVMLEPRRLATRAAARRMAWLLGEEVGATVGYVTREDRRVGPHTRIEVVTEGVLTRRLQRDPSLPGTATVIFDEVHERNLQTDLGLALLLDARRSLRPDLRLIVMSATIDAGRVAALVGDDRGPAPVIVGDAPQHPVEIRWAPARRSERLDSHTVTAVRAVMATDPGDVLVFLPGMADMRRVATGLRQGSVPADVHLLHGSLPPAEQDVALALSPHGRRRVVVATDIAESSLTVEGIRIVVDSGLAKAPRHDVRTGMSRLRTISISKASAEQRAGRAGRLGPGVTVRLWSKMEHAGRTAHIVPEIAEVDLAGLALELAAWGVPDPADLSFLDQPPQRTFAEARRLLADLGALDGSGSLTSTGRRMADLPLHPRLARMVVDAGPDRTLACYLAALLDHRDILRGHPDDVPLDAALRVRLLADPSYPHPLAIGAAVARTRTTAHDLARRAGVPPQPVDPDRAGPILALAFPDRLALRRGGPGRFQLRTGTTVWLPASDPLAVERFLIAPDLDGKRRDARVRLAAAIEPGIVGDLFAADVTERTQLVWTGDRLVARTERRLGGIVLDLDERRPEPGPATTSALVARIRRDPDALPWSPAAVNLRQRVAFLRDIEGERWPDWSDRALAATVEEWLIPAVPTVTGLDELASVDLAGVLRRRLAHPESADVDRLAPTHLTVGGGRRIAVDYAHSPPSMAVRVQAVFGMTGHPQVAGVPVVLHLLSPADRPIQITSDLDGFWQGSWQDVRRDMAGRYPKHAWPEDPTTVVR